LQLLLVAEERVEEISF